MSTDTTPSLISLCDAQNLHLKAMKGVITLLAVDADKSADDSEPMVASPKAISEALLSLELHIESAQEAARRIADSLPLNVTGGASVNETTSPESAGTGTNAPQDPHIAWFAEWEALSAQWRKVSRENEAAAELLMDRINALEGMLFNTPAHTPEGQKCQTRAAIIEFQKVHPGIAQPENIEEAYERILLEAAKRSVTPAVGMAVSDDPVVALGDELERIWCEMDRAEEDSAADDATRKIYTDYKCDHYWDQIEAIHESLAAIKATSLKGAAIHAGCALNIISRDLENEIGEGPKLRACKRLLNSAITVICDSAGIDHDAHGLKRLAPFNLNPWNDTEEVLSWIKATE